MPKYLIIFGAGASYWSDSLNTPPLWDKLFQALQRFDPTWWGTITGELSKLFESDFELAMTRVNSHSLPPLQRAMSAYFFGFQPTTHSLYYKLAQRIYKNSWDGAFVSLNYERLLETSLIASWIQPYLWSSPNHSKPVEICLPHGACHIFCEWAMFSSSGVSFSGRDVQINGEIKVIWDPHEFRNRIQGNAVPPVMSYFEPNKSTTSGTSFIAWQRNRYVDLVNSAEKIAIIGLQVRTHDNHIWKPLASTNAKIIYCSGKSAVDGFQNWSQNHRTGKNDLILPQYFSDWFETILRELEIS